MNYLAHAYLSFNEPGVLTGNMISDFVKGREVFSYSGMIYNGIRLHRAIDSFTDQHNSTRIIRSYFSPVYGLYSAVFTDVVYDYFLANDNDLFPGETLKTFSASCYRSLDGFAHIFPAGFKNIYPYMKEYDWFWNYRKDSGIERSFRGLVKRAKYMDDASMAFEIFLSNKEKLKEQYHFFFPDVMRHAEEMLAGLIRID